MGAYLSEPVTEKISNDEANSKLECGASSMQGWRVNQEDAHNTLLDFDTNTSLFAVYDGHGGAEVALFCSQKLPDCIKNSQQYKEGKLKEALEESFLEFDATIATKEVMDVLKELAGEINPPGQSDNDESEEDENVNNLYQEANLPLREVLAKYDNKLTTLHRARLTDSATPLSPCLRAKKNEEDPLATGTASSSGASSSAAGSSSELNVDAMSSIDETPTEKSDEDTGGVSSTNSNEDKNMNGEVSTSEVISENTAASSKSITTAPDSSADNCETPEQSENSASKTDHKECNGEVTESKQGQENNISSSNGSSSPLKSDKEVKSPVSSSESKDPVQSVLSKKNKIRQAAAAVYKTLLMQATCEDDESDSNDETFEGGEVASSDEENVNGFSDSSNEGEEVEEEEADDSSDDEFEEDLSMSEEPGNDSGCTAVVALLRDNELYVANAGDSRCIICRDGKALDMSVDHKPEDPPELERILKAEGKVSKDGRINGGLNLSRAIGDHSYKQKKDLGPKEQMITALPDVKTVTINPVTDQFMVLACDGIWNYMSSQEVCDFILPRLAEGREKLSQICEEMFDHCLAPSTAGDGTGCDNMTAIIVRFKDGLIADVVECTENVKKRVAEDDASDADQQETKRQKTDDTLSSSVVTSSV